jgi:hypothetical protein
MIEMELMTLRVADWIYWVGPGLGATIAAGFYKMLVSHLTVTTVFACADYSHCCWSRPG